MASGAPSSVNLVIIFPPSAKKINLNGNLSCLTAAIDIGSIASGISAVYNCKCV